MSAEPQTSPFTQLRVIQNSPASTSVQRLQSLERAESDPDNTCPDFADLGPFLDGSAEQEVPTVGSIWPGRCLFYAGRLNELHGEPSVGKTNILIAACNAVLSDGGTVLYIDPEDTPRGFATRALALGGNANALRDRVYYLHNPDHFEIVKAQKWAASHVPTMVVLDGLAESMAAVGRNEDIAGEVLEFFRSTIRPFAEAGSAVVVADHVTKSTEGRGRWARGSGAKLGRYDGAVYEIASGQAYTPQQAGFVRLKISKDRNGGAGRQGETYCEVHFTPAEGKTLVEFLDPSQNGEFRPTAIMDKIIVHLRTFGEAGKNQLRGLGKHEYVDKALSILIEEGTLQLHRQGQRHVFTLSS